MREIEMEDGEWRVESPFQFRVVLDSLHVKNSTF